MELAPLQTPCTDLLASNINLKYFRKQILRQGRPLDPLSDVENNLLLRYYNNTPGMIAFINLFKIKDPSDYLKTHLERFISRCHLFKEIFMPFKNSRFCLPEIE